MSIYVLKLDKPLKHARYYVGYSNTMESLYKRVTYHHNGCGSRFTSEALKQGITFELLVVFPGGTRDNERAIKNQKNTRRFIEKLVIKPDLTCDMVLPVTTLKYKKHWNYTMLLTLLMLKLW